MNRVDPLIIHHTSSGRRYRIPSFIKIFQAGGLHDPMDASQDQEIPAYSTPILRLWRNRKNRNTHGFFEVKPPVLFIYFLNSNRSSAGIHLRTGLSERYTSGSFDEYFGETGIAGNVLLASAGF
jgi:hypothetical protein